MMVCGILVPSTAIAFFIPYLSRLRTSLLPSTTMIASLLSMFGPAGEWFGPYVVISST